MATPKNQTKPFSRLKYKKTSEDGTTEEVVIFNYRSSKAPLSFQDKTDFYEFDSVVEVLSEDETPKNGELMLRDFRDTEKDTFIAGRLKDIKATVKDDESLSKLTDDHWKKELEKSFEKENVCKFTKF